MPMILSKRHYRYRFSKPTVKAIEKETDKKQKTIICRPICSFGLDDRLIASLYNKCLTSVLDSLFYEKSYAFRKCQQDDHTFAHLKAVKNIKDFRQEHKNKNLWVAECDMKSFYDTIDHNVIKNRFCLLLRESLSKGIINDSEYLILKRIMFSYIDCFNFKMTCSYTTKYNHITFCIRLKKVKSLVFDVRSNG